MLEMFPLIVNGEGCWFFWLTASLLISGTSPTTRALPERGVDEVLFKSMTGRNVFAPVVAVLKSKELSCSGFLLHIKYVGVACHCIADIKKPGRPGPGRPAYNLVDYDFVAGELSYLKLLTSEHSRKPRALLTHPYCENGPPYMYDVGIAVMEVPFSIIQNVIEVSDLLSTNAQEFSRLLDKMFDWKRPEDAPNCTYAGWEINNITNRHLLKSLDVVNLDQAECKRKWALMEPDVYRNFSFSDADQFCLVDRDEAGDDGGNLPTDGPVVCDGLYVGIVSYGPELERGTREVPIATQSLEIIIDWMKSDSYFDRIGCFGNDVDCQIEYDDYDTRDLACKETFASCLLIPPALILTLFTN